MHPEDIDQVVEHARAEGVDPGDVRDLSRRTADGAELRWRLTQAKAPRRAPRSSSSTGAARPTRLDAALPAVELVSFERIEVNPAPQQKALDALGLGDGGVTAIREAPGSRFVLHVCTADGRDVEIWRRRPAPAPRSPAGADGPPVPCAEVTGRGRRCAMAQRITMAAVARRAGVSPMTVSNVLRGRRASPPELRARVEEAVRETGYRVNVSARTLRSGRSGVIGLLAPGTDPFSYYGMLGGLIAQEARRHGLSLVTETPEADLLAEVAAVERARTLAYDGLIQALFRKGRK